MHRLISKLVQIITAVVVIERQVIVLVNKL